MAFNDTKQFINAVVQHQDARGISKNEILADKVAVQSRNKSERLKPRKQSRTGYGGGGELEESGGGEGGGIASPLHETTVREYYDVEALQLPLTGATLEIYYPKKITMEDANGAEVVFDLSDPRANQSA